MVTSNEKVNEIVPLTKKCNVFKKQSDNLYILYHSSNEKVNYIPLYIHSFKLNRTKADTKKNIFLKQNPDELTIPEKLKYFRHRENLLQEDVADYLGIERTSYWGYEKRELKYYPFHTMLKLAERYEVDLYDLVDDYHIFIYNQGKQLKKFRQELGNITQIKLSHILEVNVGVIKHMEKNKTRISRENYNKLMNYYNDFLEMVS